MKAQRGLQPSGTVLLLADASGREYSAEHFFPAGLAMNELMEWLGVEKESQSHKAHRRRFGNR